MMRLLLHTPGVQSWIGRSVALISWTGRRSGRRYTIPVSYFRGRDGEVTVLSRRSRAWWRNFSEQPNVELRLAGATVRGQARASIGEEGALPTLTEFLAHNTRDAKAYGVKIDTDGRPGEHDARALLSEVVVIQVRPG